MEWEAKSKEKAILVSKRLSLEFSKLLKKEVKFSYAKDIWNLNEDSWYVYIDIEF